MPVGAWPNGIPIDALLFPLQLLDVVEAWVGAHGGGDLPRFAKTLLRHLDLSSLPGDRRNALLAMLPRYDCLFSRHWTMTAWVRWH